MYFLNKKSFMENINYSVKDDSELEAYCSGCGCNNGHDNCNCNDDYYDDCNDGCHNDCNDDNWNSGCDNDWNNGCDNDWNNGYDNDWNNGCDNDWNNECDNDWNNECDNDWNNECDNDWNNGCHSDWDNGCNNDWDNSCNNNWDNGCNNNWNGNGCNDDNCENNHDCCKHKKNCRRRRKCGFMFNLGFCKRNKKRFCHKSNRACGAVDVCLDGCDNEVRANIALNYRNSTKICCRVVDCNNRGIACATVKVLIETCRGWECVATATTDCNGYCQLEIRKGCSVRRCKIVAEKKECSRGIKVVSCRSNCRCH